jgi:hypothetical protein
MRAVWLLVPAFLIATTAPAAADPAGPSRYARFRAELMQASATRPILPAQTYRRIPPPKGDSEDDTRARAEGRMTSGQAQSIGCLVAGTAGMGIAVMTDGVNLINVVAGGLVQPVSQTVLYTSLFGVVFGSFCLIGQALTPTALMLYDRYFPPAGPEPTAIRLETPLHSALRISISESGRP